MSVADALLEEIRERPDDDAPRLVYADWLEEHGESERAEFIRVQLRLAATPEHDRFCQETWYSSRQLLVGNAFRKELPQLPEGIRWADETFRRGFAWGVSAVNVSTFLQHAERLFGLAPIQHLELDGRERKLAGEIPALADSPHLRRLRSLHIQIGYLGAEPVRRLCQSHHVRGLRRLAFPFAGVNRTGTQALVRSSLFPLLEELDLNNTDYASPVGEAFAAALEDVSGPLRLTRLNLASTRFGPVDAVRLAACPALSSLTYLDLGVCSYDRMFHEAGVRALAESPHLAGLCTLRLARTEPQMGGIRSLARSTTLTNLRCLDLSGNRLGPKAGQMVADAALLQGLMELHLSHNDLTDKTARAIGRSPYLTGLAVLGLRGTKIGDQGARALLDSPNLANVLRLELWDNGLSPALKKALKDRFGDRVHL